MDATLLLIAGAATVPAAGAAWLAARGLETRLPPRAASAVWKAARLASLAPMIAVIAVALATALSGPAQGVAATGAAATLETPLMGPVLAPLLLPMLDFAGAAQAAAPVWLGWVIAALYGAGLALALARGGLRRRRLHRFARSSSPADAALEAIAARWRARLNLAPVAAPLRSVDADISPFVAGLVPVIYLPESLTPGPEAEAAIAHELTHVRRGDERDRLLGEALMAAAWFNPALGAIERRLAGARELACDAAVLDHMPAAARRGYASALAELAPRGPAATAFLTDLASLRRRRVEAALTHQPGAGRARLAALLAGSLALGAGLPPAALAVMAAGSERVSAERITFQPASPRALSPQVGEQILAAITLQDAEDWEGMLAVLDATPAATPYESSVVQRMRGTAFYQLDRLEDAIAAFEAALATGALSMSEAQTLEVNIAQLEIASGQIEAGGARIDRILADGFEPDGRLAQMFASVYTQLDDYEKALPLAEAALAAAEPDPGANLLGLTAFIYGELGRDAEAAAMLERRTAAQAGP